jgi:hypothetical protein
MRTRLRIRARVFVRALVCPFARTRAYGDPLRAVVCAHMCARAHVLCARLFVRACAHARVSRAGALCTNLCAPACWFVSGSFLRWCVCLCRLRLVGLFACPAPLLLASIRCRCACLLVRLVVCLSAPRRLGSYFFLGRRARRIACLLVCSLACARAAKLMYGAFNTNACPTGSYVITNLEQCRAAAATAGFYWSGSIGGSSTPRGCYRHQFSDYVAFNLDSQTGGPDPDCRPLCAVGAAGVRAVRVCDGIIHVARGDARIPTPSF